MRQYLLLVFATISALISGLLVSCSGSDVIPYTKWSGKAIKLINNKRAKDPSWAQLQSFLKKDTTDEHLYSFFYSCGDFAEELHNNAEASGIKAGLVVVEFYSGDPHGLNAFETVDRGLVYIDVTNDGTLIRSTPLFSFGDTKTLSAPETNDKVAYIKVGSELGYISPDYTDGNFGYDYYQQNHETSDAFNKKLDQYNANLEEYNTWVEEHTLYYDNSITKVPILNDKDYKEATSWAFELDEDWAQLEQEWEELVVGLLWEPKGKVKSVGIYW
jgi:hypothetical protein